MEDEIRGEGEAALWQRYVTLRKQAMSLLLEIAELQKKEELRAANKPSDTGVAASPAPSDLAADGSSPAVYKDITVYLPNGYTRYCRQTLKQTTQEQLERIVAGTGSSTVVRVDEEPPILLRRQCYEDLAEDIFNVELRDGMQLAVVVEPVHRSLLDWWKPLLDEEKQEDAITGWRVGSVPAQDDTSEWAMTRLAGDTGLLRYYLKEMSGNFPGGYVALEVHGMVTSSSRAVHVERDSLITMESVRDLEVKGRYLKILAEARVPIARPLLDPATGRMKPLELYLMADGWVEDPEEQAACAVQMHRLGIMPVLPHEGGYAVGTGGRPWPPQESDLRLAELFRAKKIEKQRQLRLQARQAAGDGANDAAGCGTGGSAAGAVHAVHSARRGGSASQAVCSPWLGGRPCACHPGRLDAAVGQRRIAAPLVLPARLPRLQASSSRAVVRGV